MVEAGSQTKKKIKLMYVFRHPKYYKELRKRNKLDQVISRGDSTEAGRRSPGPGLKQQATSQTKTSLSSESLKHQATSVKS